MSGRNDELREQDDWQDIASAPKGVFVLVWFRSRPVIARYQRTSYGMEWLSYEASFLTEEQPTLWHPLPNAPGDRP